MVVIFVYFCHESVAVAHRLSKIFPGVSKADIALPSSTEYLLQYLTGFNIEVATAAGQLQIKCGFG